MPASTTSSRYRRNGASSPPGSVASSSHAYTTSPSTSSPRVVTRLALEGKVKHGQDSVSMRMYLKISVPMDSAVPGSTIQLFPEENLKILNSLVHPLDSTSAPYNFSSKSSPLLHNAARALNLPQRLSQSYLSLFPISYSQHPSYIGNTSRTSSNGIHQPLLDEKYTGHILVSGYNVSYVLPKEFPPSAETSSVGTSGTSFSSMHRRRNSVSDRSAYQFMAAIDMLVPLRMKPPRAPYLLCIPVPRCLSNNVKLRIFSPAPTSSSFASLSSMEDDPGSWDLTSDPHVTRSASRHTRHSSYAYSQYADDESSDSSTAGFSEGCGLQGTFPSTDQLRIRWAAPVKARDGPGSHHSRRRVGITDVKGEMTCTILGRSRTREGDEEAVLMKLDYKATCKEVWYAGVATLLGMDVSLDTNACEFTWPDDVEPRWTISGGTGFTGWDTGESPNPTQPSPLDSPIDRPHNIVQPRNRMDSGSSSNSLLRTPLMTPPVPDYSFESATSTPTGSMISSMGSLPGPLSGSELDRTSPQSSPGNLAPESCDPASPLTIHLNMNDIISQSRRTTFSFQISGTVLVKPRFPSTTAALDDMGTAIPVVGLPRFRILAAEKETVQTIVKNEAQGANVEVFNRLGDLSDAQTRKTVLQRDAIARCGADGGRIALRSIYLPPFGRDDREQNRQDETLDAMSTLSRPGTPASLTRRASSSGSNQRGIVKSRVNVNCEGPHAISHVQVVVTPLGPPNDSADEYIVSTSFLAPSEADRENIEFGIARPVATTSGEPPAIDIYDVAASIGGVSCPIELVKAKRPSGLGIQGLDTNLEGMGRNDWLSWMKIQSLFSPGSSVNVTYRVKIQVPTHGKGKRKAMDYRDLAILIPSFPIKITRLDIEVESPIPLTVHRVEAADMHIQQKISCGWRLSHFSTEDLFRPAIIVRFGHATPGASASAAAIGFRRLVHMLPTLLALLLLIKAWQLQQQLQQLNSTTPSNSGYLPHREVISTVPGGGIPHATVTITSIVFVTASEDVPSSAVESPTAPTSPPLSIPTQLPTVEAAEPPAPSFTTPAGLSTLTLTSASPSAAPPAPEAFPAAENAVAFPLSDLKFLRLFRTTVKIPQSEDVARVMMMGVRKVWWWWQIAINYPLPPP